MSLHRLVTLLTGGPLPCPSVICSDSSIIIVRQKTTTLLLRSILRIPAVNRTSTTKYDVQSKLTTHKLAFSFNHSRVRRISLQSTRTQGQLVPYRYTYANVGHFYVTLLLFLERGGLFSVVSVCGCMCMFTCSLPAQRSVTKWYIFCSVCLSTR